jgi:hypothetical protein
MTIYKIEPYLGKIITGQDFGYLYESIDGRVYSTHRAIFGDLNGLLRVPTIVPSSAQLSVRISDLLALNKGKMIYDIDATLDEIPLVEAGYGTLQGPTQVLTVGKSRKIVIGIVFITKDYESYTDDDGRVGNYKHDFSKEYRIYMGAEATTGTETIPTSDINTAITNDGLIPLCVVTLDYGQSVFVQEDISYLKTTPVYPTSLCTMIDALVRMLLNQSGGRSRLVRLSASTEDEYSTPVVAVLADPSSGGKVTVGADQLILLAGRGYLSQHGSETGTWMSGALDTNSTYFLRAQIDSTNTKLLFYVQKGTLPTGGWPSFTYPGSLKGTPNAGSGGEFPSTPLDLLIARVTTGNVNTTPTLQVYRSDDYSAEFVITGDYTASPTTSATQSISAPRNHEYEIRLEPTTDYITATPPGAYISKNELGWQINWQHYEAFNFTARARWLSDNGGGVLKTTNVLMRPQMRAFLRSAARKW